jgi:hypothetical protein
MRDHAELVKFHTDAPPRLARLLKPATKLGTIDIDGVAFFSIP